MLLLSLGPASYAKQIKQTNRKTVWINFSFAADVDPVIWSTAPEHLLNGPWGDVVLLVAVFKVKNEPWTSTSNQHGQEVLKVLKKMMKIMWCDQKLKSSYSMNLRRVCFVSLVLHFFLWRTLAQVQKSSHIWPFLLKLNRMPVYTV